MLTFIRLGDFSRLGHVFQKTEFCLTFVLYHTIRYKATVNTYKTAKVKVIRSCTKKPNMFKALLERQYRDKKLRNLTLSNKETILCR